MSRLPLRRALACAILALLAGLRPLAAAEPAGLAIDPARLAAVGVELVAPGAVRAATRRYPARVTTAAADRSRVSAPVAGVVVSLEVEANQPVSRGQRIAEIRSPALADDAGAYALARSDAAAAGTRLARTQRLYDEGIVARARLDEARTAAAQAAARVAAARSRLRLDGLPAAEIARIDGRGAPPDRIAVLASADGIVTELEVEPGAAVELGATLAQLVRADRLRLDIRVPAAELSSIAPGAAVFDAQGRRIGSVERIGARIDASQTATVLARIDTGDRRPGQAEDVRVETGRRGWPVPASAVVRLEGGPSLLVRRGERLVPLPAEVIEAGSDTVLVDAALADGDTVAAGRVVALKGALMGIGAEAK